jgi:hypothetical protein
MVCTKIIVLCCFVIRIQRLYHEIKEFEKSDHRRRTTEGNVAAAGIVVVADAGTDAVTVATGTGSAEDKVWAAPD